MGSRVAAAFAMMPCSLANEGGSVAFSPEIKLGSLLLLAAAAAASTAAACCKLNGSADALGLGGAKHGD